MNEVEMALKYFKSRKNMGLADMVQHYEDLAITALEAQQAVQQILQDEAWIPVSVRLPQCEYGYESKQVLYQMKNTGTIESGYYGCGGKIRDKYFRHLRDSSEGVDVFDVIAWKYPTPYKEEQI